MNKITPYIGQSCLVFSRGYGSVVDVTPSGDWVKVAFDEGDWEPSWFITRINIEFDAPVEEDMPYIV